MEEQLLSWSCFSIFISILPSKNGKKSKLYKSSWRYRLPVSQYVLRRQFLDDPVFLLFQIFKMYDVVVRHHTDRTGEGVGSPVRVISQSSQCRLVLNSLPSALPLCWSVKKMLDKFPPAGQLPNPDSLHLGYGGSVVVPEQDCLRSDINITFKLTLGKSSQVRIFLVLRL